MPRVFCLRKIQFNCLNLLIFVLSGRERRAHLSTFLPANDNRAPGIDVLLFGYLFAYLILRHRIFVDRRGAQQSTATVAAMSATLQPVGSAKLNRVHRRALAKRKTENQFLITDFVCIFHLTLSFSCANAWCCRNVQLIARSFEHVAVKNQIRKLI